MDYFDRDGNLIPQEVFLEKIVDREYKVVRQDHVDNWLVSTVWLGIDYGFSVSDRPVIFETMVFDQSAEGLQESQEATDRVGMKTEVRLGPEAFMDRYCTEDEALEGHRVALLAAHAGLISRTAGILDPDESVEAERQADA